MSLLYEVLDEKEVGPGVFLCVPPLVHGTPDDQFPPIHCAPGKD